MSKRNKNKGNNVNPDVAEVTEPKDLPAEQGDSNATNSKEDNEMDSKTRRNLLQFIGDGLRRGGDAIAQFGQDHKILATGGKVVGGIVAAGAVAGAIYSAVKNSKDDTVDAEGYEEEDIDEFEDQDVEDSFDEDDSEDSTEETTGEAE